MKGLGSGENDGRPHFLRRPFPPFTGGKPRPLGLRHPENRATLRVCQCEPGTRREVQPANKLIERRALEKYKVLEAEARALIKSMNMLSRTPLRTCLQKSAVIGTNGNPIGELGTAKVKSSAK